MCFCGQVSTKDLEPFCAIPRILCAAVNPWALPGPAYFPELALMHAAAPVMLETVLASREHRVLAQQLHQEKRDEYDKHKQQQATLLAHRRVETDTEERHRLEIVKRAFVHRVDACAKEVEAGKERAVAQVAQETGKGVQDATAMVLKPFCPAEMLALAKQNPGKAPGAGAPPTWVRVAAIGGLSVAGIASTDPDNGSEFASATFDVETFGPWPACGQDGEHATLEMGVRLHEGVVVSEGILCDVQSSIADWLLFEVRKQREGVMVGIGFQSAVRVLHVLDPSTHVCRARPTVPPGPLLLVLLGNINLRPEHRNLLQMMRPVLAVQSMPPAEAAQAIFSRNSSVAEKVAEVLVPSLMDPPHPLRWKFVIEHCSGMKPQPAATKNGPSSRQDGAQASTDAPVCTTSWSGLGQGGAAKKKEAAAPAGAKTGGSRSNKRSWSPADVPVTPKSMMTKMAYLGAIWELAILSYFSATLYRVTAFDTRIAFLYALHSKGNQKLGIPGDADMGGGRAEADPQSWSKGGLLSCLEAVFVRPADAKRALVQAVASCETWHHVSVQAHEWAREQTLTRAGEASPHEIWLGRTEDAIDYYCSLLWAVMKTGKRPILFAWSSCLEESVLKTLGQALRVMPKYSALPLGPSQLILAPADGSEMLIKTLQVLPAFFDIGHLVSRRSNAPLCVLDMTERVLGGDCKMDSACGEHRAKLADHVIKSRMKTGPGEAAVREALSLDANVAYNAESHFVAYRDWLYRQPGGLDVDNYLRSKLPAFAGKWGAHVAAFDVLRNAALEVTTDVLRLQVLGQLPLDVSPGEAAVRRLCIERVVYAYPQLDNGAHNGVWGGMHFDGRTST